MTYSLTRWAIGVVCSVFLHGLAALALIATIHPDPVVDQPVPAGELDVQAYRLERSEAQLQRPAHQETRANSPTGTNVDPGAVPESVAKSVSAPASEKLAPAAAEQSVQHVSASGIPPNRIQSGPADAARLPQSGVQPTAAKIAKARVSASVAAPLKVSPAPLMEPPAASAALTIPPTETAGPIAADATELPSQSVEGQTATSPEPDLRSAMPGEIQAEKTALRVPDAESVKATLAFPGGADGVDPASLAAFQSFMEPGDPTTDAAPLRDGISALLAQVPCSRLQVIFNPDTLSLEVRGHIPENDQRAPVLDTLRDQMGTDISVSDNILILPRPQCGALAGIGNVGLPQSTDQITNPLLIGEDTHARVLDFVKDDRLWFDITAPDYDAYVYVDFFDAGGNVLHLVPNGQVPLGLTSAQSPMQVGTKTEGERGLSLLVGPPYGQEIAVAFAASRPLYEGLRPVSEPAAPYLDWLASRVRQAREQDPDFKGEWVYLFVKTAER